MKLNITVTEFKSFHRNTLRGFASIRIDEMRLTIRDVAIHEKAGARWAQLPAKPQVRDGAVVLRDGKPQYSVIMEFDGREVRDAFSRSVVAAVLVHSPNAFLEETA